MPYNLTSQAPLATEDNRMISLNNYTAYDGL
jgi:hypothetical protein